MAASKSGQKFRARAASRKVPRKRIAKKSPKRKVASKPRANSRKKKQSINPESEFQRELKGRSLTSSGTASNRRAADFEGLPRSEQADSESVDELIEEGNVFEAGAVAGVEEADDADEREVRTRELPEDDVPEEYLDRD